MKMLSAALAAVLMLAMLSPLQAHAADCERSLAAEDDPRSDNTANPSADQQSAGSPSQISQPLGATLRPRPAAAPPVQLGPSKEEVEFVFVGDIMLADLPGKAIAAGVDPFADFADVFAAADLTIGNLECVVATTGQPVKKPWTFRADPRVTSLLKKHFSAVSLANNHTGDFGPGALEESFGLLSAAKLPYFGAGKNNVEAHRHLMLEKNGIKFALLGFNEFKPRSFEATATTAGVAWSVDELVLADIAAAKAAGADIIIPFMHWGPEEEPEDDRQRALARKMIDAGVDIVIGGHPHVVQGVEYYHDKLIVYSLGNFVFDGFSESATTHGWVLRFAMNRQGLVRWDTLSAHIDASGIPHRSGETATPRGKPGSPIEWANDTQAKPPGGR